MKTTIITLFICFLSLYAKAQDDSSFLVNKTFSAFFESICMETPEPNPCAGEQVFLVLQFKKLEVTIREEFISTCGERSYHDVGTYAWQLTSDNQLKILADFTDIKTDSIKDMVFTLNNDQLIGTKKQMNKLVQYLFVDSSIQE